MSQKDIVEYSRECNQLYNEGIESIMEFHHKFKDSDCEIGKFIADNSLEFAGYMEEIMECASDFFELGRQ